MHSSHCTGPGPCTGIESILTESSLPYLSLTNHLPFHPNENLFLMTIHGDLHIIWNVR